MRLGVLQLPLSSNRESVLSTHLQVFCQGLPFPLQARGPAPHGQPSGSSLNQKKKMRRRKGVKKFIPVLKNHHLSFQMKIMMLQWILSWVAGLSQLLRCLYHLYPQKAFNLFLVRLFVRIQTKKLMNPKKVLMRRKRRNNTIRKITLIALIN